MASVKRRPDGKYRARWRDPGGTEHSKHFARKRDADAFIATIEASKLRGMYVDPTDRTTVSEYAWLWAASRPHNPRTARRVESAIRIHVEGTPLGSRPIGKVLRSEAQAWATGRSKVLAPSTLDYTVYLVRAIFGAAVLDRLIGQSPFVKLALPETAAKRLVPLTVDQVHQLADAMPDYCRGMVVTQAGLGLRIGELLALRVQDVDFLPRVVRVDTQIAPDEKVRSDPKTVLSKRSLPLPQFVADVLAARIQAYPPLEDDGSLFFNSRGGLWSTSHYGKVFVKAVAAAGLPAGTTSHDLRHHYASVLLDAGESVIAVAERLGHVNASLVLSTYGHLMPDSEGRTRQALEGAWANADQVRTAGSIRAV